MLAKEPCDTPFSSTSGSVKPAGAGAWLDPFPSLEHLHHRARERLLAGADARRVRAQIIKARVAEIAVEQAGELVELSEQRRLLDIDVRADQLLRGQAALPALSWPWSVSRSVMNCWRVIGVFVSGTRRTSDCGASASSTCDQCAMKAFNFGI